MFQTMTCRTMGGPCDATISASTAEQMMEKGMEHVQGADDEAHKAASAEMAGMSDEQKAGWAENVKEQFGAE